MKKIILLLSLFCGTATLPFSLPAENKKPDPIVALRQSGGELRAKGDYAGAFDAFSKALSLVENLPQRKLDKIDILINLGYLHWDLARVKDSIATFTDAKVLADEAHEQKSAKTCQAVLELSNLYIKAKSLRDDDKNYPESEKAFLKAIDLSRQIGSGEHEARCLRQLSINYEETNNQRECLRLILLSIGVAEKCHNKREFGICTYNLGRYYFNANIFSLAIENFEKSLKIAEELNSPINRAESLIGLGNTFCSIGQYDKALNYINQAFDVYRGQSDDTAIIYALNTVGVIFRRRGYINGNLEDIRRALSFYQSALQISDRTKGKTLETTILDDIGSAYYDLGDYSQAMKHFRAALDRATAENSKEMISRVCSNIGIVQATLGNYKESTKYYQRAIDLALQFEGNQILWETYLEMANAFKKQGKYGEALDSYKSSIGVIEDIRSKVGLEEEKASFLGTDKHIEPYQQIIDLYLTMDQANPSRGYREQAFNYLEKAKARAFLDGLEVADVAAYNRVDVKFANREKDIGSELSRLYSTLALASSTGAKKDAILQRIQNLEEELESLKREIRLKDPAYANLRFPEIITLKETRKRILDPNTAICAYSIGKERSHVFIVTMDDLRVGTLPPRNELQEKITRYLNIITDKDSRDFDLGRELGRTLIPVDLGPGIRRLIIIPDDWLEFLPFETLRGPGNDPAWLVQKYEVSYAPSLSSSLELIRRQHTRGSGGAFDVFAVGNPVSAPAPLPPPGKGPLGRSAPGLPAKAPSSSRLKFSAREIETIATLFRPGRVQTLSGAEATEENLRAHPLTEYKILHFATHANIDNDYPNRSYLLMSPSPSGEEDGYLQAREIYDFRIRADLVTLAACESGLGRLVRGEGIEGLSRAFFFAGASSVVMSLWAVNDQASSELMERFYTHLRNSESITQALQLTKVEMIGSGELSHPYYWAGFIVSGQATTRVFPKSGVLPVVVMLGMAAGLAAAWVLRKKRASLLR